MPLPYAAALPATAAADAAGGPAVPPSVAQLCNQALASTSESVVITNPALPHNPIIYANQAFESLTGKPPSIRPARLPWLWWLYLWLWPIQALYLSARAALLLLRPCLSAACVLLQATARRRCCAGDTPSPWVRALIQTQVRGQGPVGSSFPSTFAGGRLPLACR
jgi:PAS domain-containing protein